MNVLYRRAARDFVNALKRGDTQSAEKIIEGLTPQHVGSPLYMTMMSTLERFAMSNFVAKTHLTAQLDRAIARQAVTA